MGLDDWCCRAQSALLSIGAPSALSASIWACYGMRENGYASDISTFLNEIVVPNEFKIKFRNKYGRAHTLVQPWAERLGI